MLFRAKPAGVADFITAWRSENTRWSVVKAATDLGEKQIAADLLKSVLNAKEAKHTGDMGLSEPGRGLLRIVGKLLTDVAKDRRIRKNDSRAADQEKRRQ